jgi:hypothetical protein
MWQEFGTGPGGAANATWIVDTTRSRTTNKTRIFFIIFSPFKTFSFAQNVSEQEGYTECSQKSFDALPPFPGSSRLARMCLAESLPHLHVTLTTDDFLRLSFHADRPLLKLLLKTAAQICGNECNGHLSDDLT